MINNSSLGRDFAIVFAGQVMAFLQGLILMPIVIPLAGEAVYGAYLLITSIIALLFAVLGYGASYRYQRNLASAANLAERRRLFEPQFTFQLIVVGIAAIGVVMLSPDIEPWLFQGTAYFTSWYLIALLFAKLIDLQARSYFQFTRRFLSFSLSSSAASYLFVVMLILVAWTGRGLSVDNLLQLQIFTSFVVSAPLAFVLLRELGLPRLRLPGRAFLSDMRVGLPLMLELVIDFVLRSSDRYLILLFLSVSDVGRYQPAYLIGSLAIFLVSMSETVLMPAMSRLVDAGEHGDAQQLLATVCRLFVMLSVPIAIGALLVGPSLVSLLATPEIGEASRWVTPLVALGTIFYGIARLASTQAYVLGRTPIVLMANASGGVANLALNILLLPLFRDITVAAVTTVIGYVLDFLYVVWAFRGFAPVRIEWRYLARYIAAALVMGGFLLPFGFRPGVVAGVGPFSLSLSIAAAALVYFAVLFALGGVGRRELREFMQIARQRLPSVGQAI